MCLNGDEYSTENPDSDNIANIVLDGLNPQDKKALKRLKECFFIIFNSTRLALMASFLYYFFEVNEMRKWVKQYGWYVAISMLGGILGAVFSLFIWHQKNLGTIAEWVSGLGSLGAIIFAYKQIDEQRREYNEKQELDNRPYFSLSKQTSLGKSKTKVWLEIKDALKISYMFEPVYNNLGQLWFKKVFNDGYMYELTNLSNNSAANLILEVTYFINTKNKNREEIKDIICPDIPVMKGESILFMTDTMIINSEKALYDSEKVISFYFMSGYGNYYVQSWKENKTEKVEKDFTKANLKYLGIKKIDESEVPSYRATIHYNHEII